MGCLHNCNVSIRTSKQNLRTGDSDKKFLPLFVWLSTSRYRIPTETVNAATSGACRQRTTKIVISLCVRIAAWHVKNWGLTCL
jgi:hypothetical protein